MTYSRYYNHKNNTNITSTYHDLQNQSNTNDFTETGYVMDREGKPKGEGYQVIPDLILKLEKNIKKDMYLRMKEFPDFWETKQDICSDCYMNTTKYVENEFSLAIKYRNRNKLPQTQKNSELGIVLKSKQSSAALESIYNLKNKDSKSAVAKNKISSSSLNKQDYHRTLHTQTTIMDIKGMSKSKSKREVKKSLSVKEKEKTMNRLNLKEEREFQRMENITGQKISFDFKDNFLTSNSKGERLTNFTKLNNKNASNTKLLDKGLKHSILNYQNAQNYIFINQNIEENLEHREKPKVDNLENKITDKKAISINSNKDYTNPESNNNLDPEKVSDQSNSPINLNNPNTKEYSSSFQQILMDKFNPDKKSYFGFSKEMLKYYEDDTINNSENKNRLGRFITTPHELATPKSNFDFNKGYASQRNQTNTNSTRIIPAGSPKRNNSTFQDKSKINDNILNIITAEDFDDFTSTGNSLSPLKGMRKSFFGSERKDNYYLKTEEDNSVLNKNKRNLDKIARKRLFRESNSQNIFRNTSYVYKDSKARAEAINAQSEQRKKLFNEFNKTNIFDISANKTIHNLSSKGTSKNNGIYTLEGIKDYLKDKPKNQDKHEFMHTENERFLGGKKDLNGLKAVSKTNYKAYDSTLEEKGLVLKQKDSFSKKAKVISALPNINGKGFSFNGEW
eukprot:CAMPEP_0170528624 /NCGR_PEP_ID=MMETSP0209-20121228/14150_1 /TAXON_ID=665100 ORGANISM="Litonotus pictus, Strain P1" /NCGR_SAMPLE_ID=MMETSP0209 /ASSEMBLY_ACC=CAM_ASM_000301 /LENGTH=677 /DNA_ID=CAMNT_0010819989 /DNA_START=692 /DNA_END=2722 /DNA_ORIENTATION=-